MTKSNEEKLIILKYGYGKIIHDTDAVGNLVFRINKYPFLIGDHISLNDCDISDVYTLHLSYVELCRLKNTLETVSMENPIVKFKNFVFDFTVFTQKSLDMLMEQIEIGKNIKIKVVAA